MIDNFTVIVNFIYVIKYTQYLYFNFIQIFKQRIFQKHSFLQYDVALEKPSSIHYDIGNK